MEGSWLCPHREDRARLLDMEPRLKPVRAATLAVLGLALAASVPWVGWWTVVPLVVATFGFLYVDRGMSTAARPEYWIGAAWLISELQIAGAIALTGGPNSPAIAWLAIPVVTLSARFTTRGVWLGVTIAAALMLAVTLGVDAAAVAANPPLLIMPLGLLAAVAILSTALMRSDLEHRTESVLDGLTGMLNRRALSARIDELDEQARLTGEPVGIVIGDLDHFKRVNDEHGHARGDSVLVDVAYTLRKQLRAFDLAYRVGGEEFLVLLPGATLAETEALAERLRAAVAGTASEGLHVTMSFGVASAIGGEPLAGAIMRADTALYAAKGRGRDRVHSAGEGPAAVLAA